jgi:F0F1-type ATP synthase assembly protein I
MTQLTPMGLVKILGQVTAIMVIPIVGSAVVGLILDMVLATSPLLALVGLAAGSVIAAIGIGLLIRSGVRRGFTGGGGHSDGS